MIPPGLDTAISTLIAMSSLSIGLWAHFHTLEKERRRITNDAKQKYADRQLKEYAAERDFSHIKNDIAQLKGNVLRCNQDTDQRLAVLEKQLFEIMGAITMLKDLVKGKG
jgi:hypothetical protein